MIYYTRNRQLYFSDGPRNKNNLPTSLHFYRTWKFDPTDLEHRSRVPIPPVELDLSDCDPMGFHDLELDNK